MTITPSPTPDSSCTWGEFCPALIDLRIDSQGNPPLDQMKRTAPSHHSRLRTGLLPAALLLASPSSHAADRFWITPTGGSFTDPANWSTTSGGAAGATIPGAADVAIFDSNATYRVFASVGLNATNTSLNLRSGTVTLDLNDIGTYTLTDSGAVTLDSDFIFREGNLEVDTNGDIISVGSSLRVTVNGHIGSGTFKPKMNVGDPGGASVTVDNNGRIDLVDLTLGHVSGWGGSMTLTGPLAILTVDSSTGVGSSEDGTLQVLGGASLTAGTFFTVGGFEGVAGDVTVSGAGSEVIGSGNMDIGCQGTASLTIAAGGLVISGTDAKLGDLASSTGVALITGRAGMWGTSSTSVILGRGPLQSRMAERFRA